MAARGAQGAERRAASSPRPASRRCPKCQSTYPLDFVVCPKDASPLEKPDLGDDPLLGEILAGSFCITGLLGEGAMGRVYEAEHTRLPRRFAIKLMHEELLKYPDALARVEREAQAIARITSEHVIDIVDLVRLPDGRPCLVTELLDGVELGELLEQRRKLAVWEATSICRQVCRGLAAAHALGILHRDLKPSNLFLVKRSDNKPFVKILDFGIAKVSDGAQLTLSGVVLGTPAYMAPEQARGEPNVDARADVYSVGAVLYHMLTGSAPYVGDDPAVLLARLATEDPPPPRSYDRTLPESLDRLVMRALARKPADRPQTLVDFERELDMADPSLRTSDDRASTTGGRDTVIDSSATPSVEPTPPPAPPPPVASVAPAPLPVREDVPPRWSARATTMLSAGFAALIGAATFEASAIVTRLASAKGKTDDTGVVIGLVIALVATGAMFAVAAREASARRDDANALSRLGSTIARAAILLLSSAGLAAILWSAGTLGGAGADGRSALKIELVLAVAPLLLGLATFATGLGSTAGRRAR